MAENSKTALGPSGEALMHNVKRLREGQKLTYVELSERLTGLGRPIPVLGLRRIERGERRVDVDDLMALAHVLGVVPTKLLVPSGETSEEVAAAAQAGAHMAGFPAPWDEVREGLFHLSLAAAFSPAAYKTIRSMIEKGWFPEKEATSINQVMRSSWEMQMRTQPSEPPEEGE